MIEHGAVSIVAITSALGQKQTCAVQKAMSALPPKRTFAVQKGMSANSGHHHLFDHLVGACEQGWWHSDAERIRRREIDDELEFSRLLDWHIAGLRPPQNPVHVICRVPKQF